MNEELIEIIKNQVANIAESNATQMIDDLEKKATLLDGSASIASKMSIKLSVMGDNYLVDVGIEWELKEKRKDELDTVTYNPNQPDMFDNVIEAKIIED